MAVAGDRGAELDELSVNTIRTLAIDAVQTAGSGHPGTPMAMAPVVYTLWQSSALRSRRSDTKRGLYKIVFDSRTR